MPQQRQRTAAQQLSGMQSGGASQAHSIQQSHAKDIQHLKAEAIEEEKREHLAFLAACDTALRASPPEALE